MKNQFQGHIKFSESYHKLDQNIFPTVRGKTWMNHLRVGQRFKILKFDREFCHAEVIDYGSTIVGTLPLSFMKQDGEYPGFKIKSKQDYFDLLNRYRRFYPVDDESIVTVIQLKKIST
jgi:hypothetical protein